jgi:hypothetical protein
MTPMIAPPGGWTLRIPETGFVISRITRDSLIAAARDHLRANHIEKSDYELSLEIDRQICARNPEKCGDVATPAAHAAPQRFSNRRWSLTEVIRGALAWLFDMKPANMVPMEQARRRAAICAACPKKVDSDACQSCSKAYQQMVRKVGESRINPLNPYHLKICDACGCFQAVKVQLKLDAILRRTPDSVRAALHPKCWILTEEKGEAS